MNQIRIARKPPQAWQHLPRGDFPTAIGRAKGGDAAAEIPAPVNTTIRRFMAIQASLIGSKGGYDTARFICLHR